MFGAAPAFARKQEKNLLNSRAGISTWQAQEKHCNLKPVIEVTDKLSNVCDMLSDKLA
jgi:hypothetical protein